MTQCGDGLADAADFLLANGAVHNLVIGAIFCTGGGNLLLTDRCTGGMFVDGLAFELGVVVLSLQLLISVEYCNCNSLIRGDQLRTFLVAVPAGKLRTFLGCGRQDVSPAEFARTGGDAHKSVANGGQTVDRYIFRSGHVQFFQHGVGADAIKGDILAEIQTGDLGVTHIQLPESHVVCHINLAQGIPVTEQFKQSCIVAEIQSGQLVIAAIQG